MSRRLASAVMGVVLVIVGAGACGGDSTPVETGSSTPTSAGPVSATTSVSTTTVGSTAPPATAPPPETTLAPAVPPGGTVALGQDFLVNLGESVAVTGEGLTVTYAELVADSRCPPDVQCIWAGNATIAVAMAKEGGASATVQLNTMEGPKSAPYSSYTAALLDLAWGPSPTARLLVT